MVAVNLMNLLASMERSEGSEPIELPPDSFVPYRRHKDRQKEKLSLSLKALDSRPGI